MLPFPKADRSGRFVTLASGFANDNDGLPIRADARVLGATLKAGESVEYAIGAKRHGYLVPALGAVEVAVPPHVEPVYSDQDGYSQH